MVSYAKYVIRFGISIPNIGHAHQNYIDPELSDVKL